jgi:hypothetical protein
LRRDEGRRARSCSAGGIPPCSAWISRSVPVEAATPRRRSTVRRISRTPGMKTRMSPASRSRSSSRSRRTTSAARSSGASRDGLGRCSISTGWARVLDSRIGPPSASAIGSAPRVALMTRSLGPSPPSRRRRSSPNSRSASSERSWNSSSTTTPIPGRSGRASICRRNRPSVMNRMRVSRPIARSCRVAKPTSPPPRPTSSRFATRCAVTRVARRRGCSTTIRPSISGFSARRIGTPVVLPEPVGATSTAAPGSRIAVRSESARAKIGRSRHRSASR